MTARSGCVLGLATLLAVAACDDGGTGGAGGSAATTSTSATTGGGGDDAGATTTGVGGQGLGGEATGGGGAGSGGDEGSGGHALNCGDTWCGENEACQTCTTDDEAEPPHSTCVTVEPEPTAEQFRCANANCGRDEQICEHLEEHLGCDGHDLCRPPIEGCADCACIEAFYAEPVNGECLDACTDDGAGAIAISLSACAID